MRKKFQVHSFELSDLDDATVYAAGPIWEWQKTEIGQWVMANAADIPTWHTNISETTLGYEVSVIAEFEDEKITEWLLRSKT